MGMCYNVHNNKTRGKQMQCFEVKIKHSILI